MITNSYEYLGYFIEIHEHPIYHDFEFVIKTLDKKEVKETSHRTFMYEDDANIAAQAKINHF